MISAKLSVRTYENFRQIAICVGERFRFAEFLLCVSNKTFSVKLLILLGEVAV